MITPQSIPIDIIITAHHDICLHKTSDVVDTISNIQPAELNSKPHGGKSLIYIIGHAIGIHFYPPPGSSHHKLLQLDRLHGYIRRQ